MISISAPHEVEDGIKSPNLSYSPPVWVLRLLGTRLEQSLALPDTFLELKPLRNVRNHLVCPEVLVLVCPVVVELGVAHLADKHWCKYGRTGNLGSSKHLRNSPKVLLYKTNITGKTIRIFFSALRNIQLLNKTNLLSKLRI